MYLCSHSTSLKRKPNQATENQTHKNKQQPTIAASPKPLRHQQNWSQRDIIAAVLATVSVTVLSVHVTVPAACNARHSWYRGLHHGITACVLQ